MPESSPDKNVEAVRQRLLDRSKVGLFKYGVTTERNDLSALDWLNHLQEELMDAAIYCRLALEEALGKQLPNCGCVEHETCPTCQPTTSGPAVQVCEWKHDELHDCWNDRS